MEWEDNCEIIYKSSQQFIYNGTEFGNNIKDNKEGLYIFAINNLFFHPLILFKDKQFYREWWWNIM